VESSSEQVFPTSRGRTREITPGCQKGLPPDKKKKKKAQLWKTWTYANLWQASTARLSTKRLNPNRIPNNRDVHRNLDPVLQRAHTKYGDLEPHVLHAITTARQARINIKSCALSAQARSSALADYHHALSRTTVRCNLEVRGITTVGELVHPVISGRKAACFIRNEELEYTPSKDENTDPFRLLPWDAPGLERVTRLGLLENLLKTNWHPQLDFRANNRPQGKIAAWQEQADIKDCLRAYTGHRSILTPQYGPAGPANSRRPKLPFLWSPDRNIAHGPIMNRVTHVYTDGSAMHQQDG